MQSATPAAPPALHLLTSYFIDSILGRGTAAGRHGTVRAGGGGGASPLAFHPPPPAPVTPRFSPLRRGARGTAAAAARPSARPRGGTVGAGEGGASSPR